MNRSTRTIEPDTYVAAPDEQEHSRELFEALITNQAHSGAEGQPYLVTADNTRHVLTPGLADLLAQVARTLAEGQAVSVIPRQLLLTTQEAADLLNISRPTLIKRLEAGDLEYEMRGRHRRIRLEEVLDYQQRLRVRRSAALDAMQRTGQADRLYELLDGPPPPTR